MYHLLGLALALAALLTSNALGTLAGAALWRVALARPAAHWAAAVRARVLFALRLAPFALALLFVGGLVIPAYVRFEPQEAAEVVSLKLALLALGSTVGLALALWRGIAAWLATRRLVADWQRHAEPVALPGLTLPVYAVAHRFPVVAVVGAFRPRLFIARQIFATLDAAELRAALAHECGHLAAHDNLKRALLRACRDVLTIVPAGRTLDRAWAESAEAAADEHAAHAGGAAGALDLAAALVKIARLVPVGTRAAMPAGAFLIGELHAGGVAWRVQRLTQLATDTDAARPHLLLTNLGLAAATCVLLAGGALIATDAHVLAIMHTALEQIVNALK